MYSATDSTGAVILGFLIRDADSDWPELLPLEPGVTVLYGLNGAGKSRTLDDIYRFWSGTSCNALALLRVPELCPISDWDTRIDQADWFSDWARRAGVSFKGEDDILDAWLRTCLSASEITVPGRTAHPDRLENLIDEWFEQRLVLVQAIGADSNPQWMSVPAFMTGARFPTVTAEVELYESIAELAAWGEHDGECFLEPIGSTEDGRTISCASRMGTSVLDRYHSPFFAGQHQGLPQVSPTLLLPGRDVDERTRTHLTEQVRDAVSVVANRVLPSEPLVARVRHLERLANEHFRGVLQDAPGLRLHVDPVGLGCQVEWFVEDDAASHDLEHETDEGSTAVDADARFRRVEGLSTAQRRWALWSIGMAIRAMEAEAPEAACLVLVDEPEAALHRSAESQMAGYLRDLASDGVTQLIVATHSPELLDLGPAQVYEVDRHRGRRRLVRLSSVTRHNMQELGLLPSDLLRRQRGFILVEGEHDELMLKLLFGDEFHRLRVDVLPMRGTRQLSPAKIGFLFDYTPAHVFIMLDNIRTSELADVWGKAIRLAGCGDQAEALRVLDRSECLATDEGKKLREVLQRALTDGQEGRVTPHGLSHADIIEYLPVEAFVPGAKSWDELRSRHRHARAENRQTPRDFKDWLKHSLRADFGQESMRQAIERLDHIPADMLRLLKAVEAHTSR